MSERLACGVAFGQAVPEADLALAELPAQGEDLTVPLMGKVDQPQPDVLDHPAQTLDLVEPGPDPRGQALEGLTLGPPGPLIDHAAADQGDSTLLGSKALAQRGGLGVRLARR